MLRVMHQEELLPYMMFLLLVKYLKMLYYLKQTFNYVMGLELVVKLFPKLYMGMIVMIHDLSLISFTFIGRQL